MHAYLYTRKSRHLGDPDDPHLLEAHVSTLLRLAAADGITIRPENIRTEIGSGESIAGRPVFEALLREWEALPPGAAGIVYVIEPSRLSRGTNAERGRILDALIRARLIVASPERRYDPANPSDELTWSLVQAVDHNEISRYRQRVAIRRADMTRQGQPTTGNPPWGYLWIKSPGHQNGKKLPGHFAPDPDRFPILVAVCREVLTTSILRLAEKYDVPYGILQDTLHNPVICGYPARRYGAHHGTKPWKEPLCLLPREQWIWPEEPGDYPAACTRAQWDAIQAALAARHSLRLKTGPAIENGWCRPRVSFTTAPGPVKLGSVKHGVGLVPTYTRLRRDRPPLYVEREPVHAAAVAALAELLRQPLADFFRRCAARQAALPEPGADTAPLRARLARERGRLANLKDEAALPDLDAEELRALDAAQRDCRRRLDALKEELALLETPRHEEPDLLPLLPDLLALTDHFSAVWERLAGSERQEIVLALLKEIPVTVIEGKQGVRWQRHIGPVQPADWLKESC